MRLSEGETQKLRGLIKQEPVSVFALTAHGRIFRARQRCPPAYNIVITVTGFHLKWPFWWRPCFTFQTLKPESKSGLGGWN